MPLRPWTEREIERLVDMTLDGVRVHDLARQLRRAKATVRKMQAELALIDPASIRRRWTKTQLEEIRELYADTPTADIAQLLGRPVYAIYNAAEKMGLKKSRAFMQSPAAGGFRKGDESGKAFRYPKGHVPFNKGRKMPGYAPGRMAETQFRKGERGQNCMPLGSTRLIDGYLYRKTSEIPNVPYTRNWRLEHYLIWEKENGPVPAGHALVFRDGDRTHVSLDNLELITRADLARRNTIHKLPEDLKEVIRLNASIKRRIRRICGEKQNERLTEPPIRDARSAQG